MGTTLTGLTPATTYDALIKVTDNGPLSATAKYLSDGLGNDSILALSTNKVGIGTFAPSQPLDVNGNMRLNGALYDNNNLAGTSGQILSSTGTATNWIDVSSLGVVDGSGTANYVSKWSDPNTLTNSLIYDNGTNVGIGTSSPDSNLVVDGSGSVRVNLKASNTRYGTIYADSGILALASITAIPLVLATDDTERLRITSTGNVGIGTSAPAGNLHIASATDTGIRIQAGASSLSYIDLADTASGAPAGSIAYNHIVDAMTFATGGSNTERMRITSTGNVGIGTSTASRVLTLKNNTGSTNGISFQSSVSTSELAAIECNQSLDTIDLEMVSNYSDSGIRFLVGSPLVEQARVTAGGLSITSGNIALSGAGGIYFDNAGSKYLDDYEEGTWTPATSTSGYTISASSGSYTKIGRQVTIRGQFSFSAINALSSSFVIISGLPFTPASDFSGSLREGTNTGAVYTARVNSGQTNATCNSMDGVATASTRIFAINENYDLNVTYFV